ncbi:MAG: RNA-binding protein [Rickettsiales bacterium]|nr:RNA-binding protein [Actinomycetota bacterium]MBA94691.1 RNA-binding protein [Rickettsiales bacterium]MBE33331.1 RNA-binding protein [bacterium]|tara:strand:+ start:304 stop:555 length:252 start_codon:yes stop_codon:yes gene_type:complete
MSNNKIYVGNLDYQMSDEDLKSEFSSYGEIQDVIIIKDHETGRSKGFGFVTFAEESALEKALELDGQEIKGRQLRVNKARPKQ